MSQSWPIDIDAQQMVCGIAAVKQELEELLPKIRSYLPMKHRSVIESKIRHLATLQDGARELHRRLVEG